MLSRSPHLPGMCQHNQRTLQVHQWPTTAGCSPSTSLHHWPCVAKIPDTNSCQSSWPIAWQSPRCYTYIIIICNGLTNGFWIGFDHQHTRLCTVVQTTHQLGGIDLLLAGIFLAGEVLEPSPGDWHGPVMSDELEVAHGAFQQQPRLHSVHPLLLMC